MGNYLNVGVVLVFNHCFSDIFLMSSKMLNFLGLLKGPGFIVFAFSHVGWVWLRLFSLPMLILNKNESLAMSMRPEFSHLWMYQLMNEAFLWALIALHYYWYFLIVRITWRAVTKGEVKDTHNDVSA